MGLFNKINGLFSTNDSRKQLDTHLIDSSTILSEHICDMQKIPASESYRDKVYKKYYKSYPIKPFISMDREKNTNWLEQAEIFSKQSIIPISMMTQFNDGLLPGHVYMLYWINKNGQKKVPSYFEYKYGIEFDREKKYLINNGYLVDDKLTNKGEEAINVHYDIIEAHSPKSTSEMKAKKQFADSEVVYVDQHSKTNGFVITQTHFVNGRNLMLVSEMDKVTIFADVKMINELLTSIRKQLKIREELNIPISEIVFNNNFSQNLYTYFEYEPLTTNGKQSKYPFELYITTREHFDPRPNFECFGSIGYLKDNRIGRATFNFWYHKTGYHISLGMINNKLSVKKIEQSLNNTTTTIYKK